MSINMPKWVQAAISIVAIILISPIVFAYISYVMAVGDLYTSKARTLAAVADAQSQAKVESALADGSATAFAKLAPMTADQFIAWRARNVPGTSVQMSPPADARDITKQLKGSKT